MLLQNKGYKFCPIDMLSYKKLELLWTVIHKYTETVYIISYFLKAVFLKIYTMPQIKDLSPLMNKIP